MGKKWDVDDSDIKIIQILIAMLEPCKDFIVKMSSEARNLIYADTKASEVLSKIEALMESHPKNLFIKNFYKQLNARFKERRSEMSDILIYLCKDRINPEEYKFYNKQANQK